MSFGNDFKGLTEYLAKTANELSKQALPHDVRVRARHCLLDWFSLVLSAGQSDQLNTLSASHHRSDPSDTTGSCTVLFHGQQVTPQVAMMLNGTAGHLQDFDDTHLVSRVHPSVPLWPVLWCEAEKRGLTGEQLISAFVVGVQIQSQLAQIMGERHYALGWHNTATLGAFGATAALGIARGFDSEQLRQAFGFVATQAGGLRKVFGSIAKPLQVARAGLHAYESVGWVESGLSTVNDVLDGRLGFSQVYGARPEDASNPRPGHWWVRDIVFKYHASCYGTQAPVQAALEINSPALEAIDCIRVFIEPQYMNVCNVTVPTSVTEAKFSVRHMVAMAMTGENTASEIAILDSLKDRGIAQWREKIRVESCTQLARAKSKIMLVLNTGEVTEYLFDASQPEPNLDVEAHKLIEKSRSLLAECAWSGEQITWLQSELLSIDECTDMTQWLEQYRARLN